MRPSQFACPNEACANFGRRGEDNRIDWHATYGQDRRRLLRCRVCGKTFSERRGTAFFNLKASEEKVQQALALLAEGVSQRAVARLTGVSRSNLTRWLKRAAEHAKAVSDKHLRDYHVQECQLDELWSFVKKKSSGCPSGSP